MYDVKIEGRVRILGKIKWRCGNKQGQTDSTYFL